jgi:hypothetical protein
MANKEVNTKHTRCYKDPISASISFILVFAMTLSLGVFAFIGIAFIFAFYVAWSFTLKDDYLARKEWDKFCDSLKFGGKKDGQP